MPQNPTNITESPEFKEFCKKNNLEVFNQESVNIFLLKLHKWQLDSINEDVKLEKKIEYLTEKLDFYVEEINKLREMINEIAKNILIPTNQEWSNRWYSLFDKWNKNEH